ncbi:MAG: hypothetical protein ISS79_01745 [Phycisphaerae bacterium]|nr:hypothetical protein [Phycisphaerae bacterium]
MNTINNDTNPLFEPDLVTAEAAHQTLHPYYSKIVACPHVAFAAANTLRKAAPEICAPLESLTWANIIHNHMVDYAKRAFAGLAPDIILSSEAGFLIIDFHAMIKMRFKKLRDNLHPCNIKTGQQQAYEEQTLYDGAATLVTTGYRVDAAGLFRDAHIVCWSGSELRWSLRLPDPGEMQQPTTPIPDSPLPVPIVVGKKPKQNKRKRTS